MWSWGLLALLPQEPIWACFVPIIHLILLLYQLFLLLYALFQNLKFRFWCISIAENCPAGTSSLGDQWANKTTSRKRSIIKNQRTLANGESYISRSIRICLTDVRHPASAHSRLKLITQCINGLGNACAFVQPDVISGCDTEFDTHLKIIDMISIIGIISIK